MKTKETSGVTDYRKYTIGIKEYVTAAVLGGGLGAAGTYIMFGSLTATLVSVLAGTLIFLPLWRKKLCQKRRKKLLLEFRDFLDCLAGSFSAGKNPDGALRDAVSELGSLHGKDSMMSGEALILYEGLHNSGNFCELLSDFALRSGLDDVQSFADTFAVASSTGGNLRQTVCDCRGIICERITIEAEIEDVTAANRNELYIMCVLPFVAAAVMRSMGNEVLLSNTPLNIIIKLGVVALVFFSYYMGKKLISFTV